MSRPIPSGTTSTVPAKTSSAHRSLPSAVHGTPVRILRSEGLVLFAAALAAYFTGLDQAWWLVPLLLFAPDLFMAGYAASNRAGAAFYNLAHSYPAPAVLGAVALAGDAPAWQGVALIWFAHIGMDRALGYGLKYETGFGDTHLGRIGQSIQAVDGGGGSTSSPAR